MQADIVWFVINALDGRIFVCGSSKGMGEGVEESLIDVAMQKGRLSEAQAKEFWARKREDGQYIAVSNPTDCAYIYTYSPKHRKHGKHATPPHTCK